jgi:hypothetical protein
MVITGKKAAEKLAQSVYEIEGFPDKPLIDRSGWNGLYFALPDGTIFSAAGAEEVVVVFDATPRKCRQAGTMDDWTTRVAKPLTGQSMPMFAIMLTFLPPLLRLCELSGNPGFEIVGPPGTGKSTVQKLASSVLGGVEGAEAYHITFDTTLNALEAQMAVHADLPMILEEANLFFAGETPAKRANSFKALAFRMSAGREKERYNLPGQGDHRFAYLSSSNESLTSLIGAGSDVAKAAGYRLITLEISPNHPFGVFDNLPPGYDSTSEYAGKLVSAASRHHGHAIRKFLAGVVQARADSEAALRRKVGRLMKLFRDRCQVDLNDGSAVRIADLFGLVFAAGRLARDYGALPREWHCGDAVLACYERHLRRSASPPTVLDRLLSVANSDEVIHLRPGATVPLLDVQTGIAFVRHRATRRELVVRRKAIGQLFSDWSVLARRPDVKALLVRDGKHLTTKRKLNKLLPAEPVYCFALPLEAG